MTDIRIGDRYRLPDVEVVKIGIGTVLIKPDGADRFWITRGILRDSQRLSDLTPAPQEPESGSGVSMEGGE